MSKHTYSRYDAPVPSTEAQFSRLAMLRDILPEGATTQAPPSGRYMRVLAGLDRRCIGHVSYCAEGYRVRVFTRLLAEAPQALLQGTTQRDNGRLTATTVTVDNVAEAAALLAEAARVALR